jgi:hypothetical protein
LAIAAGLVAVPAALAGPGHHAHVQHPAKVRYEVTGVATSPATTTLALSGVKYHPASLGGTSATLTVSVGVTTKYANRRGRSIAQASIMTGDRIEVVWVEASGTTPSTGLTATKVVDLGPPAPVHYTASGVADAAATCTVSVTLDNTHFRPASLGTKGSQTLVLLGTSTKLAGRWGHPLACASIAKGDHLKVTWTEPAGTPFSLGLTATRVVDTNRGHR